MTKYGDFYYCEVCGHVVSVLVPGQPTLVCCGQKMVKLEPNTKDAAVEKHVPVIVPQGNNTLIKVGSASHPMSEEHHIEFIEIVSKDGSRCRAKLEAGDKPEAKFNMKADDIEQVYEFCNLHGLWKA